jgi:Txe/YoeB family toxin of Txe-Axe toxin-antitoxin module
MEMDSEEKLVLYTVLQDMADELREIKKSERKKSKKIDSLSKRLDAKSRTILQLKDDEVTELIYSDDSSTVPSSVVTYDLTEKKLQQSRPDLMEWANIVKEKIKEIENEGK